MIQTLLVMKMHENYPFVSQEGMSTMKEVGKFVRQAIPTQQSNHNTILSKAIFLKNLRNRYLVRVESVQQQEYNVYLFYEYIECEDWTNLHKTPDALQNIQEQLAKLILYLKNIGLQTELLKNQIGVTQDGKLKFFMGLNFQFDLNEDQNNLDTFYRQQFTALMDMALCKNNTTQCSNSVGENQKQLSSQNRQRKVSFATLPSHHYRLQKLDRKLSGIKNNVLKKEGLQKNSDADRLIKNKGIDQIKGQSNLAKASKSTFRKNQIPSISHHRDRIIGRKFSDNLKCNFQSLKKLEDKESDIVSERGPFKSKFVRKSTNQEDPESPNLTTRGEQFRNREYLKLAHANREYFQDFCSVLDDKKSLMKAKSSTDLFIRSEISETKLKKLKEKTYSVIQNSKNVMKRFKAKGII